MASRIGALVARRARWVLLVSAVILVGAAVIGVGAFSKLQTNDAFQDPSADSTTAQRLRDEHFGGADNAPAQRATVQAAVGAVKSGPLGQNGVPAQVPGPDGKPIPFNPLQDTAFHALSHAYAIGYLVCGLAALAAALLAAILLGGQKHHDAFLQADADLAR